MSPTRAPEFISIFHTILRVYSPKGSIAKVQRQLRPEDNDPLPIHQVQHHLSGVRGEVLDVHADEAVEARVLELVRQADGERKINWRPRHDLLNQYLDDPPMLSPAPYKVACFVVGKLTLLI